MKRAANNVTHITAVVIVTCLCASVTYAQSQRPIVMLGPTQTSGDPISPWAFLNACANTDHWSYVRSQNVRYIGNADWIIDLLSDQDQAACFQNMNNTGLSLALGVGVLKPVLNCDTGSGCFFGSKPKWDRMISNGASIGVFALDEPLTAVLNGSVPGDFNYALEETRTFIRLVRRTDLVNGDYGHSARICGNAG